MLSWKPCDVIFIDKSFFLGAKHLYIPFSTILSPCPKESAENQWKKPVWGSLWQLCQLFATIATTFVSTTMLCDCSHVAYLLQSTFVNYFVRHFYKSKVYTMVTLRQSSSTNHFVREWAAVKPVKCLLGNLVIRRTCISYRQGYGSGWVLPGSGSDIREKKQDPDPTLC